MENLLDRVYQLEEALKRSGWNGKSDITKFPYVSGTIKDPKVYSHITEHLGMRIGDKVIANGDIDDNYYAGTTARIVDVQHGMLVIQLSNGVILDDQDPEGFEEANDAEDHIETWENSEE